MPHSLMELTFDSIADGIIATNCEGRIQGINLAALEMLQATEENTKGRPLDEVFRLVDKETDKPVTRLWLEALETGKKVSLHRDVMLVNREGSQSYVSAKYTAIQEKDQPPEGVVVVFRDVSRLRGDEEKLHLYRMALEQSPNAVVVTNDENHIVYVNRQFSVMTGYGSDETLGKDPGFLKSGSTPPSKYKELWQALEAGQVWKGDFYNQKKNGQFYWEKAEITPIQNSLGKTTHYLAIKDDVTLQKAMEEELTRTREMAENNLRKSQYYMKQLEKARKEADLANRAKSEFLANMSHEIRTPLNGMMGMISLMEIAQLTEEQQESMDVIRICGDNLLNVINSVLDFSKIESGKMDIEKVPFQLSDWLTKTMSVHQSQAGKKGIELLWAIDPHVPDYLMGDPKGLQQILNNLVGNAVKFTESGWVRVTVDQRSAEGNSLWVDIQVTDTGIGIPQKELPRLFDSFTQLDGSITRRFGGTGLGLTISRKLAELMGGSIEADSTENEGSTFTVSLPLEIPEKNELEEIDPQRSHQPSLAGSGKKILIAEDDAINQMVIKSILKGQGYEIAMAKDGVEAVEQWESFSPDAILMDIQMPGLDGMEATVKIRHLEKAMGQEHYTPIIALTAHALQGDRERFLSYGMDEYIAKPIDMDQLYTAIEKVISDGFIPAPQTPKEMAFYQDKKKTENQFISHMFTCMDALETAIEQRDHDKMDDLAQQIKGLAITNDEKDIKNRAFKVQLSARKKDIEGINSSYEGLQKAYKAYLSFAVQADEWKANGGDEQ